MNVTARLQHTNQQKQPKKENEQEIVKDMLHMFTTVDGKFAMALTEELVMGRRLHMMHCFQSHRREILKQTTVE
jgi:hypothetical protein